MKKTCAGIFEQSMGAKNRVGIGLSYWPTRLHRLAESIPGLFESFKILSLKSKILCQTPFKIGSAMTAVLDPIQFLS